MDLLERCRQHGWRRVAFIGIAKHAGKTTALNRFLQELAKAGAEDMVNRSDESQASENRVGLLSIGLDGERRDTILGVQKPRVYAEVGTLVASAEGALLDSEARFEWIEELPISSPLGPVMIARVTTPGPVVLAGIRQRAHVRVVADMLEGLGCEYILVDGAFDRVAAAAPTLVDAAVLAVGAVVGNTVSEVVQQAQPLIERFALRETDEPWKQLFCQIRDDGVAGIAVRHHALEEVSVLRVPRDAVMFDITRQMGWSDDVVGVYIPGAVTDGVVGGLLRHPTPIQIVADHPAQILISGSTHRKLARHGHRLSVWTELPLAAIAVNPHHIAGADLPRDELFAEMKSIAGDVPVYDAMDTPSWYGHARSRVQLPERPAGVSGEGSAR